MLHTAKWWLHVAAKMHLWSQCILERWCGDNPFEFRSIKKCRLLKRVLYFGLCWWQPSGLEHPRWRTLFCRLCFLKLLNLKGIFQHYLVLAQFEISYSHLSMYVGPLVRHHTSRPEWFLRSPAHNLREACSERAPFFSSAQRQRTWHHGTDHSWWGFRSDCWTPSETQASWASQSWPWCNLHRATRSILVHFTQAGREQHTWTHAHTHTHTHTLLDDICTYVLVD